MEAALYLGLTPEELRQYFAISSSGRLIHNSHRPDHTFTDDKHRSRYYNNFAGRLLPDTPDANGYALVRVLRGNKRVGYRHIVVWLMFHGWSSPEGYKIIHLDGNKLNDNPDNLALVYAANPTPQSVITINRNDPYDSYTTP